MNTHVTFLNSDDKTEAERLVSQNSSIISITRNQIGNVTELTLKANNTVSNLENLLTIYTRVFNSVRNLTKAVSMLIDLEEELYVGTGKGKKLTQLLQSY